MPLSIICNMEYQADESIFPRSYRYSPEDMALAGLSIGAPSLTPPLTPGTYPQPSERPQTTAYALCDSPPGLLAYMLEIINPPPVSRASHSPGSLAPSSAGHSPTSARSPTSPQSIGTPAMSTMSTPGPGRSPTTPLTLDLHDLANPWTPTAIISWTMLYWLPGPEVALRWLVNSANLSSQLWTMHSSVPLGITHFRELSMPGVAPTQAPPQWAEAYHRVAMVRRREGRVRFAAWERPAEVVMDIRELAGILGTASTGD